MLWLKRNNVYTQLMKCDVSNEIIAPGDFYYIDDEDGMRIKATVYKDIKDKSKKETWDYSELNAAQSEREYKRRLQDATSQAREKGMKESLVLVDNLAFIVNVKNNTVITAVNDTKNAVFTNIDGAIINQ